MPGRTGYELLKEIRTSNPDLPVVIITAFGTIPQAVQAIRDGAFEYVTKPFDLEVLKKVVALALSTKSESPKKAGAKKGGAHSFIAQSEAMREVFETAEQVADSR